MVSFHDRRMSRVVGFLSLFLAAIPAWAGLSPALQEWGAGPAQWIMTSDEQRAWRKVSTDSEAVNFIDLFWVRRDPSVGTAMNEFRNEYENRVAFSDKTFKERRKRGAMSDRGRVYIVLGAATNMTGAMRQTNAQQGVTGGDRDPSGGRQMAERDIWIWEHADARKFEMGRIEVVFIEDPTTRSKRRDPQRTDFGLAGTVAIRKAIVSPDLTSVPPWAPTGGLKPMSRLSISEVPASAIVVQAPPPPAPSNDILHSDRGASAADQGPAVASNAPGASRLMLLAGESIDARSSTDPFAVKSETTFKGGDDIPWAVQYCSAKAEVPKLKFMLVITGPLDGGSTERVTREKDAKPERMTAQPGCYVLQGTMPASQLTAGRYKLSVLLDSATGDSHTVKREFRIE